jgi:hypothetical protein
MHACKTYANNLQNIVDKNEKIVKIIYTFPNQTRMGWISVKMSSELGFVYVNCSIRQFMFLMRLDLEFTWQ